MASSNARGKFNEMCVEQGLRDGTANAGYADWRSPKSGTSLERGAHEDSPIMDGLMPLVDSRGCARRLAPVRRPRAFRLERAHRSTQGVGGRRSADARAAPVRALREGIRRRLPRSRLF